MPQWLASLIAALVALPKRPRPGRLAQPERGLRPLPADEECWRAYLGGDDLDEPAELVILCTQCADREFGDDACLRGQAEVARESAAVETYVARYPRARLAIEAADSPTFVRVTALTPNR
jgi:hypothetical protein